MSTTDGAMKHPITLRWFKKEELDALVAADETIFRHPWKRDAMKEVVVTNNNLCLVAEAGEEILGFLIFEIQRDRFYILKMGVIPGKRQKGVGTALLNYLRERLSGARTIIETDVRESLALVGEAYKFYQKHGFKGAGMDHEFFKVYAENADEPSHVEAAIKFVASREAA